MTHYTRMPAHGVEAGRARHGRGESPAPQAARCAAGARQDDHVHEVRMRSNDQTPLADVAAAADANASNAVPGDSRGAP